MPTRTTIGALTAALLCGLLGCTSSPGVPAADTADVAAMTMTQAPAEFAAAASILEGFELADSPEGFRTGDRVLIGIRIDRAGDVQIRYLQVELTERLQLQPRLVYRYSRRGESGLNRTFESIIVETNLTLFDQHGRALDHATGKFPVELLGCGLYDGADPMIGAPATPSGEPDLSNLSEDQFEHAVRGWLTLVAFSGSMNKKGMFRPLIEGVIAKPSLLALLLNPSFSLSTTGGDVQRGEPWTAAGSEIPTVRLPLICTLAGTTCATAQVLAARPVAPLSLCGGIVRLVGRNPADPSVRFEFRLVGAARGPASPAPGAPTNDR